MSYDVDIWVGGGPACTHCNRPASRGELVFHLNAASAAW